jgi:hypothetical protein
MIASSPLRHRARRVVAAATLLATIAAPIAAQAGDGDVTQRIVAENLFAEGKARMEAGRLAEACPKLAESQRIAPAGGTILLLALCHEQEGRLASAWAELRAALAAARRAGRTDRIAIASDHIASIEPRLAHTTVVVGSNADVAGLDVVLDGVTLMRASCNSPIPLDPGLHEVAASAPGRASWHTSFVVRAGSDDASVVVPVLLELPRASAPSRARPLALGGAVAALGIALGLTAYWGVRAVVAEQSKPAECRDDDATCTGRARSLEDQRARMASLATVAAGVGALAAGAAITLWLTAPVSRSPSTGVTSARLTLGTRAPGSCGGSLSGAD